MKIREFIIIALVASALIWTGNILYDVMYSSDIYWPDIISKSFWACVGVWFYLIVTGIWAFIKFMIKL